MRQLVAVLLVVALGCSSSDGSNNDGGAGSGGTGAGGAGGMAPPAASCQAIRLCSMDCADDACVATNCLPMGSTAAQAQFQLLHDCTKAAQPTGGGCATPNDVNCLCLAQCLQDPPCGDLAMACTATVVDTICDIACH